MLVSARRFLAATALGAVTVAFAGCTAADPMPTPTPTPSYTSDYVEPAALVYAPLTGMAVDDPAGLAHAALSAKVDNHWNARPQAGLERTDIVVEELVEGGLTRYVAIWHSNVPAEIGPVRSIRPMDPDIISPFGGIVAYSGGQYRFVELMRSTNVYNAIHGQRDTDDVMFRARGRTAPHNVLVRAPELIAMHPEIAAPPQQYAYAPDVASATATREGATVAGVDLVFGSSATPSWRWDAASERWLRSQDGEADLDTVGAQLSAVNVVIVRVAISNDGGVPKTELIGSGEAWVLSGGAMVHATWSKPDRTAPIRLVDDTGAVVRLAPGNSWVELVPNSGSVTQVPLG